MPTYYVNKNRQTTGDQNYEVHIDNGTCPYPPNLENRVGLGFHANCQSAVAAAERAGYSPANGCYWCLNECHTG